MTELDPTSKIGQRNSAKKPPARPAGLSSQPENAPTADRVTLSHKPSQAPLKTGTTTKTPGQVRDQLVSKFRDYLEQGTYQVKADEIAKKMVQKIQDDKDQTII